MVSVETAEGEVGDLAGATVGGVLALEVAEVLRGDVERLQGRPRPGAGAREPLRPEGEATGGGAVVLTEEMEAVAMLRAATARRRAFSAAAGSMLEGDGAKRGRQKEATDCGGWRIFVGRP